MKRGSIASLKWLLLSSAVVCLVFATPPSVAQDDPPAQAGRLSIVNGTVSIQPGGTQDWGQAYLNYPLGPGDRIFTDSDGRAEIQVGRTYVRLGPNTDVTFIDFTDDAVTFGAAQGAVRIRSFGMWDGQSLYIQTPGGTATAQGLASFRVDVYPDEQAAIFTNNGGDLYISGANDFGMDAVNGQSLELVGTNPVYPQWLQPSYPDALDDWSESRSQQISRASWRYVSPEAPGGDELDSYGQWTPGTEYGDMWFPTVEAGWAPYHNGRWVNHAPWGWVWVEDEPWGYSPFHYGRWINYHGRWGWIPGPREEHPVWSPALVVFAGGISIGGGGVSVWFPLGPGEPYRPWYPCSSRYIDRVNISNIRETNIVHVQKTYVNIVNVTNVTNITYVNRTAGVTAMRQQDFAAGRSVAQASVHVDPQQMQHVQVVTKIEVAPARSAVISAPPARPVPVSASRPVMINAKGMAVTAQPKARPAPPPVKTTPPPPALPNRTVVAAPPNVKMTPSAQKAMQAAPRPAQPPAASHPGQPSQPAAPGRPAANPPATAQRPATTPSNPPRPAQVPAPTSRPPAQPSAEPKPQTKPTPPARPAERPAPPPAHTAPPPPKQNTEPTAKPAPRQQPPPPDKNKKPEDKEKKPEEKHPEQ
jgi:uncharacterized protein DUF6600